MRNFKVETFDSTNCDSGQWEICKHIRCLIFCQEMNADIAHEFDRLDDSSYHVIGSREFCLIFNFISTFLSQTHVSLIVGDAPFCVSRWHLQVDEQTNIFYAVIDRFGILMQYRMRGFGKKFFEKIISDIQAFVHERSIYLSEILIEVWEGSSIIAKLKTIGFIIHEKSSRIFRGSLCYIRMSWDGTISNVT